MCADAKGKRLLTPYRYNQPTGLQSFHLVEPSAICVTEGDINSQQRQTQPSEAGKKDLTVGSRDWERESVELEGAI